VTQIYKLNIFNSCLYVAARPIIVMSHGYLHKSSPANVSVIKIPERTRERYQGASRTRDAANSNHITNFAPERSSHRRIDNSWSRLQSSQALPNMQEYASNTSKRSL